MIMIIFHLFFSDLIILFKTSPHNLGKTATEKSNKAIKMYRKNNALTVDYIHTYTKSKMRQTEMTSSHDIITPASEKWHLYITRRLNTDLLSKTVERRLRT